MSKVKEYPKAQVGNLVRRFTWIGVDCDLKGSTQKETPPQPQLIRLPDIKCLDNCPRWLRPGKTTRLKHKNINRMKPYFIDFTIGRI